MKRVMCVWLPNWPVQRIRHARPELKKSPVVLFSGSKRGGQRVTASSRDAAERGVAIGMPLAEAQALIEGSFARDKANRPAPRSVSRKLKNQPCFAPHEPECDHAALQKLAQWCQRFSPLVGVEPPDCLLLDIAGSAHLFGEARGLGRRASEALADWFVVRIGIGAVVGAAWALAHYAGNDGDENVASGHACFLQDDHPLDAFPIEALRLPDGALESLHGLGVHRVADLQALPRASLPSRFGPDVARRIDQAFGRFPEPIIPIRPPAPIEAERAFEHPLSGRKALEAALRQLIDQIVDALVTRQVGVARLLVHARYEALAAARPNTTWTVGMLRPSMAPAHIAELVLAQWDQRPPLENVVALGLQATSTAPIESPGRLLFEDGPRHEETRELTRLVDRMSNRLGEARVVRPRLLPDAQPECAVIWTPAIEKENAIAITRIEDEPHGYSRRVLSTHSARPIHLLPEPIAIDVTSIVPDGPPICFFWKQNARRIARAWGPERIETGWWRRGYVQRDYYRVETELGRRFWIFRRVGQGDWFLHGAFE